MKFIFKQQGFSVVELMVALLLGLFLVSGVTGMYISSKQTNRMTDNLSRLQESLRFSLEFISRDIRMAGYMPCRYPPTFTNAMNGNTAWFLDFFNYGIRGYEGSVSTFPTSLPAVGTGAGDRVAGTDALAILKGSVYASSLTFHNAGGNMFTLQNTFTDTDFDVGRIAIVCDPRQASLFQVSNVNFGAQTISYGNNTVIAPGNFTTNIGNYSDDAQITSFEPVIYYIAVSTQNPSITSLKKQYLEARLVGGIEVAQMREEELLEGVESMQILYGVDVDNDQIADRFEAANTVTAANQWLNVITVRLGLLMATGEEVTTQLDTNTYNVAGTLISDTTTPAHSADRRLRYVINTTINLRNRVQ
jgi:type IV pilus assembly protein PilW